MIGLTDDCGGEESLFLLLDRTLSKHDKLYIKESASDCEHVSLKGHSAQQIAPLKT